jgi:GT2 family glycosyltransferase
VDDLESAVDCSVVIVNYHTDEVLAESLASLAKTAGGVEA